MEVEELLAVRDKTHGNYDDTARAAQLIKEVLRAEPGWKNLSPVQKESIDLFASKLGRILGGNPNFADHWDDIAGYAKLISQRVSK